MNSPIGDPAVRAADHLDSGTMLDLVHGLLQGGALASALAHLGRCTRCETTFQTLSARRERIQAGRQPHLLADGVLTLASRVELAGRGVRRDEANQECDVQPSLSRVAARATGLLRDALIGTPDVTRRSRRRWAAVVVPAAVVLVVALGILRHHDLDRAARALPILPPLPDRVAHLSAGGEDLPASWEAGLRAYQRKDFAEAARLLTQAAPANGHRALLDVYAASALAHLGRQREAVVLLRGALAQTLPDPLLQFLEQNGAGTIRERARRARAS
jgi:hypothetical protein